MKQKETIDWAGRWLKVGSEIGNSDAITFFMKPSPDAPPVERHFNHREKDGYGAIMQILRTEGYLDFAPPTNRRRVPSRLRRWFLFWRALLTHPSHRKISWSTWHPERKTKPHQLGSLVFTDDMEKNLKDKCAQLKVSANSYLLALFSQVIRERLFLNSGETANWMVPVSMRDAVADVPITQNCVSFVHVSVPGGVEHAVAANVAHKGLKTALAQDRHWGFWELYQIGKVIGEKGMRYLSRRARKKSFWTGSFSNLGDWQDTRLQNDPIKDWLWIFSPHGSANYPVGICVLKWFGRRVITLKVHPSITDSDVVAEANAILAQVREDLKSSF